jgi:hypothetical protein
MAHRPARLPLALACLALGSGCAGSGPLASRGTMIGSLKASVGQLEAEKEALRREVAELRSENREVQDRLVEAESANGELAARLDDARHLIRRQGGETASADGPTRTQLDPDFPPAPRTSPAGRNSRKGRKAPLTQIPGVISVPDPDEGGRSEDAEEPVDLDPPRGRDEIGPQSRREGASGWLPMARGRDGRSPTVR